MVDEGSEPRKHCGTLLTVKSHLLSRLVSRRHVDFGRTRSSICLLC